MTKQDEGAAVEADESTVYVFRWRSFEVRTFSDLANVLKTLDDPADRRDFTEAYRAWLEGINDA